MRRIFTIKSAFSEINRRRHRTDERLAHGYFFLAVVGRLGRVLIGRGGLTPLEPAPIAFLTGRGGLSPFDPAVIDMACISFLRVWYFYDRRNSFPDFFFLKCQLGHLLKIGFWDIVQRNSSSPLDSDEASGPDQFGFSIQADARRAIKKVRAVNVRAEPIACGIQTPRMLFEQRLQNPNVFRVVQIDELRNA